MITVYETNGCSSCRYVKNWLENEGLEYQSTKMEKHRFSLAELKSLFSLAVDADQLISMRSNIIKNFEADYGCKLEDLSFNQLLEFLQSHPLALKRPIITDGQKLQVGWDADEMTIFLPHEKRLLNPARIWI